MRRARFDDLSAFTTRKNLETLVQAAGKNCLRPETPQSATGRARIRCLDVSAPAAHLTLDHGAPDVESVGSKSNAQPDRICR
jgi:hypothetical protein